MGVWKVAWHNGYVASGVAGELVKRSTRSTGMEQGYGTVQYRHGVAMGWRTRTMGAGVSVQFAPPWSNTTGHMCRSAGRTLMIKIAELVLKNPGRKEQMKAKEAAAKAEAGGSSSAGAGGSKPAPSKKGKKGKK